MMEELLELKRQIVELSRLVGEIESRLTKLEEYNVGSGVYLDGVSEGYQDYIKNTNKEG